MTRQPSRRRQLIAGLGTAAAAAAIGAARAGAQGSQPHQPARHDQDEWLDSPPAKHRVVIDATSAEGVANAIRFASNLFTGSRTGYGLDDADVSVVICLRHGGTSYAYTDALWSKYGAALGRLDPGSSAQAPTRNPYESGDRKQLSALAARGVRFMVCALASRGLATRAAGQNGDVDATFKEFEAALIPSARFAAAGVVGVTHAQDFGYRYLFAG